MKTLRLSDEDYEALLACLATAEQDARACEWEFGICQDPAPDEAEAHRLYELLKPMSYDVAETDSLFDQQFPALCEAMNMLKLSAIPVTLQVTRDLGKDTAVLEARQVRYWLPEGYQFSIG